MTSKVVPVLCLWFVASFGSAATFMVTTTLQDGPGSLRQAILDANTTAGTDEIRFQIPPDGPHTIDATLLPEIQEPVILDGTTQPGYVREPIIELDSVNFIGFDPVLSVAAGSSVIRGLSFHGIENGLLVLTRHGSNHVEG